MIQSNIKIHQLFVILNWCPLFPLGPHEGIPRRVPECLGSWASGEKNYKIFIVSIVTYSYLYSKSIENMCIWRSSASIFYQVPRHQVSGHDVVRRASAQTRLTLEDLEGSPYPYGSPVGLTWFNYPKIVNIAILWGNTMAILPVTKTETMGSQLFLTP